MKSPIVKQYSNLTECSESVAAFIVDLAKAEIDKKNSFSLVLTGGKTPRILYERLAQPTFRDQINWQKTSIFWGDERCVPPTHPDSNYALAHEYLLSKTDIPFKNIYRIPAELSSPKAGAETYEETLQEFFHSIKRLVSFPSFDLILLGMGQDGHIASLFPDSAALREDKHWVAVVDEKVGSPRVSRITLTLPVINQAKCVLFLIAGPEKQKVAQAIFDGPEDNSAKYPAAMVRPVGRLFWFIAN